MAQEPKPGDQPHPDQQRPAPTPAPGAATRGGVDVPGPDDAIMAIRKAAGSIAEVFDGPSLQPQRVRIG